MYVMEYLIYHLRPYGVNARFVTSEGKSIGNPQEISGDVLFEAALAAAKQDQGSDDWKPENEQKLLDRIGKKKQ